MCILCASCSLLSSSFSVGCDDVLHQVSKQEFALFHLKYCIPTAKHSPNSTLRYLNCKLCRVTWCSVFDYYDFCLLEEVDRYVGGLFLWAFTMHRHSLASDDVMESESKRSRISFAPSLELLTSFQKMAFARRPPSIRLRCAETCGSLISAHRHGHAA